MAKIQFHIITIFPNIFDSYLNESILGRAQKQGLIEIKTDNLRDYTSDKHHRVDDSPYGGGVGMVMMVEPIYKALKAVKAIQPYSTKTRTILLSPRGKRFTQKDAQRLIKYERLVFVCGRYEGIDERVSELVDEKISIGDFVLNGGELAAMAVIESVARLIPGVLGKDESSKEESFSDDDSVEYPHYTRPEIFSTDDGTEMKVPDILLSGDHKKIEAWRAGKRIQR